MGKKRKIKVVHVEVSEEQILQEFGKIRRSTALAHTLKSIHNPVFSTISKRLHIPTEKIYRVIRDMQPILILKQQRYYSSSFYLKK